jgi:hypothetical protein
MDERPRAGRCPAGCPRRSSPPAATPAPGGASHASAPPTTDMQVSRIMKMFKNIFKILFDIGTLRHNFFYIRNLVYNFTVTNFFLLPN